MARSKGGTKSRSRERSSSARTPDAAPSAPAPFERSAESSAARPWTDEPSWAGNKGSVLEDDPNLPEELRKQAAEGARRQAGEPDWHSEDASDSGDRPDVHEPDWAHTEGSTSGRTEREEAGQVIGEVRPGTREDLDALKIGELRKLAGQGDEPIKGRSKMDKPALIDALLAEGDVEIAREDEPGKGDVQGPTIEEEAERLGIDTEGKSADDVLAEIEGQKSKGA